MTRSSRLLPGTVDLVILKTLAPEPMHGFGVSRQIRERTSGVLELEDAALYQALHRMERKGWIESEWGISENNRRAKYYRLTSEGAGRLEAEARQWHRYAQAIFQILEGA